MAVNLEAAQDLFASSDYDGAILESEQYLKRHPGDLDTLELLARCYFRLKQTDASIYYVLEFLKIGPRKVEVLNLGAENYILKRKPRRVAELLSESLSISPDNPETQVLMAASLIASKKEYQALFYAEKAIKLSPTKLNGHVLKAATLIALKRKSEALIEIKEAKEIFPKEAIFDWMHSGLCYREKDFSSAKKLISLALEKQPNNKVYEQDYLALHSTYFEILAYLIHWNRLLRKNTEKTKICAIGYIVILILNAFLSSPIRVMVLHLITLSYGILFSFYFFLIVIPSSLALHFLLSHKKIFGISEARRTLYIRRESLLIFMTAPFALLFGMSFSIDVSLAVFLVLVMILRLYRNYTPRRFTFIKLLNKYYYMT